MLLFIYHHLRWLSNSPRLLCRLFLNLPYSLSFLLPFLLPFLFFLLFQFPIDYHLSDSLLFSKFFWRGRLYHRFSSSEQGRFSFFFFSCLLKPFKLLLLTSVLPVLPVLPVLSLIAIIWNFTTCINLLRGTSWTSSRIDFRGKCTFFTLSLEFIIFFSFIFFVDLSLSSRI